MEKLRIRETILKRNRIEPLNGDEDSQQQRDDAEVRHLIIITVFVKHGALQLWELDDLLRGRCRRYNRDDSGLWKGLDVLCSAETATYKHVPLLLLLLGLVVASIIVRPSFTGATVQCTRLPLDIKASRVLPCSSCPGSRPRALP